MGLFDMNVLSLFSGIGLHDLGLERAGWEIACQVENDPWCLAVLAKHWPTVPRLDNVRSVSASALCELGVERVDLVTGGFPCQDVSVAGKGAGLDGARSGLWHEMRRIVSEVRPHWVLAENVHALRTRGADRVLADLEAEGYACWPLVVGAEHVGAPHRRHRVWIVAHRNGDGRGGERRSGLLDGEREARWDDVDRCGERGLGDAASIRRDRHSEIFGGAREGKEERWMLQPARAGARGLGDHDRSRLEILRSVRGDDGEELEAAERAGRGDVPDAESERRAIQGNGRIAGSRIGCDGSRWPARPGQPQHEWEAPRLTQSGLGGAAHGYSRRVDSLVRRERLRGLGNANPPQVAEAFGRAILREDRELLRTGCAWRT